MPPSSTGISSCSARCPTATTTRTARGDGNGILWIETDTGGTDFINDQVLAVIPSSADNANGLESMVDGADEAQLKRFAVGPNDCEVTGIFATPDKSALFINIQPPGNWPSGADATAETGGEVRPRAATVVIQKADGGPIGV